MPDSPTPPGDSPAHAVPAASLEPTWAADTIAVQAGRPAREPGAPVNAPITLSSTYLHDAVIEYGRDGNAGWSALEAALGALDAGRAVTFASGLAAATAIADLVPSGGTVVIANVTYYGVRNIFERLAASGRLQVRFAPADDTAAILAAADGSAMVWVESIANPLMVVADVPAIADGARERGAITVVDATFATPMRQQPLALGADIVLHSATKLIGGHSDLLLGAAVCRDDVHADALTAHRHDHGAIPGALEAFLALRGLRTLAVRLDRSEASALELARRLAAHPHVARVHYPGLPGDPQHATARRVLPDGAGPMLSFEVAGTTDQTEAVLARLRLLTHATSLGGVETLVERRARYAGDAAVVGPTLCRLSVGIENVEDLWSDLGGALSAVLG